MRSPKIRKPSPKIENKERTREKKNFILTRYTASRITSIHLSHNQFRSKAASSGARYEISIIILSIHSLSPLYPENEQWIGHRRCRNPLARCSLLGFDRFIHGWMGVVLETLILIEVESEGDQLYAHSFVISRCSSFSFTFCWICCFQPRWPTELPQACSIK
ncbi:hypothetical protein BDV06DRAFT_232451 [Aspergillus oleicola]